MRSTYTISDGPPEEMRVLAKHHKQILERKFQNYACLLVDWPDGLCYIDVEVYDGSRLLLVASFASSRVHITRGNRGQLFAPDLSADDIIFDYADPRFTENTLSDILTDVLKSRRRA